MSTAKRRINFTGRKRIRREDVEISLLETRLGETMRAKAKFLLIAMGFLLRQRSPLKLTIVQPACVSTVVLSATRKFLMR
jgi:hypothetical protein